MILAQRFLYRSLRAQIFEKKVSNFSKTPKKKIVSRSWAKIGLRKTQPNVCSKKKSRGARTLFSKFGSYSPFPNTSHRTPFSLPMPALTPSTRWPCYGSVFMDRASEVQRITFYTADAAELCMSYVRKTNHFFFKWYVRVRVLQQ